MAAVEPLAAPPSEAQRFEEAPSPVSIRLASFEKYVGRNHLMRFAARYELFRRITGVKGSIVECGVHQGGGVMAWAKLCSTFEPLAFHRRVIGFDTFEGFPEVTERDAPAPGVDNPESTAGGWCAGPEIYRELNTLIADYDDRRPLSRFPKIELVRGDALRTIPDYVRRNRHLVVSLLFLDFDLYEPTKIALEWLRPRMPRGSVIAFDEVNSAFWPGETEAMLESFDLSKLRLEKFPFDANIAFAVL